MTLHPADRLLHSGFQRVAAWQLDGGGIVIADAPRRAPAVYVFVVDGEIQYVGSASVHLLKRMCNYAVPGKLRTAGRLNALIREELRRGRRVEILAAFPEPGVWRDLPVDLVLGLEAGLIREFNPPWNRRGNGERR